MRAITLALACFAYPCHSSWSVEHETPRPTAKAEKALAKLLAASKPASGWQALGHGGLPAGSASGSRAASRRPEVLMEDPELFAAFFTPVKDNRKILEGKYPYLLGRRYKAEYDDDICLLKKELLDLRFRRACRQPFKPHEFRMLKKEIARLEHARRIDEMQAMGIDTDVKMPKTRKLRNLAKFGWNANKRERKAISGGRMKPEDFPKWKIKRYKNHWTQKWVGKE
mmetsp:Transcript_145951/g.254666  ORF Transcript_145951/g.254666 Transcript_145951/m.254666 type:complete len:226 (+) Transcript_145951:63-740(+)